MIKLKRTTLTTTSMLVLAVLFIALIMLSNALFRGWRIDLTENGLYTLSEGTRKILTNIDEPINLYYFYSDQATESIPFLRNYANRVRELLEELAVHADGKLKLHLIDPQPFSEEEDRASQYGLQAIPVGTSGENIYFGLAGTNAIDSVEIIPFFQPDKEAFLEYDLSKLVYTLAHPKKSVIGLLSTLPMNGGFDPLTRQMGQPWFITNQIKQLFEVRELGTNSDAIDKDVDVLMLVHPKNLADKTLYAIDQFILGGGKAMVFVDPHAEAEVTAQDPTNPMAAMMAERSSNLPKLFEAWGVEANTADIVGDRRFALSVNTGSGQAPVRHLGILGIDAEGLNSEDVVTAELNTVNLATAGYVNLKEGSEGSLLPLIRSSSQAMPMPGNRVRFLADPANLQQDFQATGEHYPLAVRFQGKVRSAFPEGAPEEAQTEEAKTEATNDSHLAESADPINVVIVADTDLLTDQLWVQVQNFFGQPIATAWANNSDFVINTLDNLTGSSDLIGIRGRATSVRPFDRVQALEREADDRFRATEQKLQDELQETERKLNELQTGRQDRNPLILSPEQRAELERFQQQKLAIRKQLRQVRHDLDKDIQNLGTTLKIINIGLVPLLISIFAVVIVVLRIRHRKTVMGATP